MRNPNVKKFFFKIAIITICVSSCASGGNGSSDLIDNSVITTVPTGDQRYSFETFENKMTSPWGEVVFTYSVGEYRPSRDRKSVV